MDTLLTGIRRQYSAMQQGEPKFIEFSKLAWHGDLSSPERFRIYYRYFWAKYHLNHPGGFAPPPVPPSGVVGQGAILFYLNTHGARS